MGPVAVTLYGAHSDKKRWRVQYLIHVRACHTTLPWSNFSFVLVQVLEQTAQMRGAAKRQVFPGHGKRG